MFNIIDRSYIGSMELYSDYLKFLDDENEEVSQLYTWRGISIQKRGHNHHHPDKDLIDLMSGIFKLIIKALNLSDSWLIFHEYKKATWFINSSMEETLPILSDALKNQSKKPDIDDVISCDTKDLLELSDNLVRYSPEFKYRELNCLNETYSIIIKPTHHATIDVITSNAFLLDRCRDVIKNVEILKSIDYNR